MVYGIVKQSNGSIWVFSELERGTAFKIYLPRYVGESETAYLESRPDTKPVRGSETILLVEDDRSIRLLLTVLLEHNGFKVLQADNGLNALQTAAQHAGRIDLLITDIIMPKISGRVLADRLIAGGLVSKVLYISGYTETDIVHQGVLNEGTPFLPKPFSNDAFLRKVREMLDLPPEPAA
jgi:CheY-like chemotaxis protein